MLFYDKIKTPSHQGERCAVINTAGGTCSCCRPIYPLLQPPATSTPAKLPCTNGLPQLAGSCIKENQDLISEILEKTFCFFVCLLDREQFNRSRLFILPNKISEKRMIALCAAARGIPQLFIKKKKHRVVKPVLFFVH